MSQFLDDAFNPDFDMIHYKTPRINIYVSSIIVILLYEFDFTFPSFCDTPISF